MAAAEGSTVHASCVLTGPRAVLIRGPAGSGKSRLAHSLVEAGRTGRLPFARLVADDRVRLSPAHGRLLAKVPEPLRGQIEIRGLGIRRLEYESCACVGLVVDLAAADAGRLPEAATLETDILGVTLSRLPIASGEQALAVVVAALLHVTEA
jgi:serine kinase of HPr protein (carbohydrate metabolism regulator)